MIKVLLIIAGLISTSFGGFFVADKIIERNTPVLQPIIEERTVVTVEERTIIEPIVLDATENLLINSYPWVDNLMKQAEGTFGAINYVGGKRYGLSSAITSSATTIIVTDFTMPITDQPLIMADFGEIGYATIDPGNSSRKEFISFTAFTQDATNNRATLTGVSRGLSFITPYTASTTLQIAHSGGANFIISNPPQLYDELAAKRNNEVITGQWTFNDALPTSTLTPTTTAQFTTKTYVDNVTAQGAATATEATAGISELATLAQQADSADTGVNDPLVLQSKNATSTCQIVGSYNIIASSTTGKLDGNCFDLALDYIHTGANTFNDATTTIIAATGTALNLNGQDYAFPNDQNAGSSTSLQTDGNGTLLWDTPKPALSASSLTNVTSSGATTTFVTFTVPAFSLSGTGVIHGTAGVNFGADADAQLLFNLTFGGEIVASTTLTKSNTVMVTCLNAAPTVACGSVLEFWVVNDSSNNQEGWISSGYSTLQTAESYQTSVSVTASQTLLLDVIEVTGNQVYTLRNSFVEILR